MCLYIQEKYYSHVICGRSYLTIKYTSLISLLRTGCTPKSYHLWGRDTFFNEWYGMTEFMVCNLPCMHSDTQVVHCKTAADNVTGSSDVFSVMIRSRAGKKGCGIYPQPFWLHGGPSTARTCDRPVMSRRLYQLSYGSAVNVSVFSLRSDLCQCALLLVRLI